MRSALPLLLVSLLPSSSSSEIVRRPDGLIVDSSLARQAAKDAGQALESDPAGDDIILFENGDVMHGTFGGIDSGLLWERKDMERPIRFELPSVRQIVRKGGRAVELHLNSSFFTLVSGDRIPGEIVSLDAQSLVIKSEVVGDLTIPRAHLQSITPNPFDGELFYSGPYTGDGWMILEETTTTPADEEAKAEGKDEEQPENPSPWVHSGASFYNLGPTPLVFLPDTPIPDVGRFSFRVEWKGRLNLNLALLSDFTRILPDNKEPDSEVQGEAVAPPAEAKNDGDVEKAPNKNQQEDQAVQTREERLIDLREGTTFQSIPWIPQSNSNNTLIFGSGYTLTLNSSYPYLSRNSFTEAGEAISKRLSTGRSSISLSDQENAHLEIRYDRKQGLIMLFVNGDYAAQWTDLAGMPGNGSGFGILNATSVARTKISEVMITSWNGMKDSAQSMSHSERDVILLVNGTDRFSGDLLKIADGVAHIKSDYLTARIPVNEIARIILKESGSTDLDSEDLPADLTWKNDPVAIVHQPFGLIKLNPVSAGPDFIMGTSPFLGELKIDLDSASVLRFVESSPDLVDWFDDL